MRRIITNWVALLLLALVATMLLPTAEAEGQGARRDSAMESQFVAAVNQQRANHGLPPLTWHAGMADAAVGWASEMVNGSFLAHAGSITGGVPAGWAKVGENVGRGQTVASLTQAFMNSPSHRASILDPLFTHIGVGVFIHPGDGRVYTAHRFAALGSPAAPPAPTAVPTVATPPTAVPTSPPAPTAIPTAAPIPTTPPTPVPTTPPAPTAAPTTPPPPTPVPAAVPTSPVEPATSASGETLQPAPEQLAFTDDGQEQGPKYRRKAGKSISSLNASLAAAS